MPLDNEGKVRECLEIVKEDIFTEWEVSFLRSVLRQLIMGATMSVKQEKSIDRCYDKACASPY
ncbi:hypothetical protein LCGC14_1395200 [marine sediment metagenome]|uniref:Uncharacterized protein n=1 Tax=marine sediment metagenome TaxID=412755 RepID=A0A0F9JYY9_9ZZZZ